MADNKNKKRPPSVQKDKENAAFYRIVVILLIAVTVEAIGMIYYRRMGSRLFRVGHAGSMNTARYVFAVLTVLAAGATAYMAAFGKKWKYAAWALIFAFSLFVSSELIYYAHGSGALTVCVAAPVLAALAFVYIIFGHVFFAECSLCTLALVTLAAVRGSVFGLKFFFILTVVLSAAVLIAAGVRYTRAKSGDRPEYTTVFIAAVLTLAASVLGVLLGSGFAYGAIFAVGAFRFIDAVYHTVKLM